MLLPSFKLRSLSIPFALGLSLLTAPPSLAAIFFTLAPMVTSFAPVGRGAAQAFQVVNGSGDTPVAVELYMVTRAYDLNGQEINNRKEAEENFLVYPTQVLLQPGEAQTVRVNWLGEAEPNKELAFRLIAEQLPGLTDTETTRTEGREVSLTTLVRYAASVYITPAGVSPDVVIESATHQKNAQGKDELVITFQNKGTSHFILSDIDYTLTVNGKSVTTNLSEIPISNLLAGDKRRFVVPWPEGLPVGEVSVTMKQISPGSRN